MKLALFQETVTLQIKKRRTILIVAAIVVALGIVAGLSVWLHDRANTSSAPDTAQSKPYKPTFKDKINGYVINGKYDEAAALIQQQPDPTSPTNQQLLASVYSSEGNDAAAMEIYATLKQNEQLNVSAATDAGRIAEQQGNKALAIEYYTVAKDLVTKDTMNPVRGDDLQYYTNKIKELQP